MQSILQDVRYGLRRIRRAPGFAMTAILTLALGIGATTAIFTLIYQVLLRSMPVDHPEQIYKIGKENECCVDGWLQNDWRIFSYDLYRSLRDHTPGTDGMAAVEAGSITVSARHAGESSAQTLDIRLVSGNYFSVLGAHPLAGRLLRPDDDQEGAPVVAVISHAVWQSKFHSDPGLVGETILLTGHPVTVVGITAPGFLGDRNSADPVGVWIPVSHEPLFQLNRKLLRAPNSHWLDILIRIRDPKAVAAVEKSIQGELLQWIHANRDLTGSATEAEIARQTTEIVSASGGINDLRDQYEKSLKLLQMIAAFVLLIACANLANLMLVRGLARRQELNIRSALGASRSRLIREMLTEAILLSLLGGVAALGVAYAGVNAMLAMAMKGVEINPISASPSLPVLGFALAVSALTGILFGIAPAWIASRSNPAEALHGANRTTGNAGPLQRALVILQAALSVGLLSTAGLLILSLQQLQQQDFYFQPEGRLIAFIDLQAAGYRYEQLDGLYRQVDQTFASIPELHDVAYATYGPMSFMKWRDRVALEGGDPNANLTASYSAISPGFFDAVGTRLLMGRVFTEADSSTSRHVAIVNKTFVQRYLDRKQPIGAHFGPDRSMAGEYEIVGVVDDSKYGSPSQATLPMFFTPLSQTISYDPMQASQAIKDQLNENERYKHFAMNLIAHYQGDPAVAAAAMRKAILQINPEIPIRQLTTYDDQISSYFIQQKLVVRLTTLFGVLALVLASIGLYGVTAYGVARRVPEIGLRMALGADRASVMRLVLRGAASQTLIGLLLGIPGALIAGHYLQSQLYEVKGINLPILFAACAVLSTCALLASALPAHKASNIEPVQALRQE